MNSAYNIILYTQGNETGKSEIDINKLLGISIYGNKNGTYHHSFYKKLNNEFVIVKELDLNCDKITFQNTAFVISYVHFPTNQLSTYNITNPQNLNNKINDIETSMELEDFVSYYYGKQVKLDDNQIDNDEAMNMIAYGGGCGKIC